MEAVDVEVQVGGVLDEVGRLEALLALEQQVVHLPELALLGRGLGGLRRQLRGRVHIRQWQVSPHEPKVGVGKQVTGHRFGLRIIVPGR